MSVLTEVFIEWIEEQKLKEILIKTKFDINYAKFLFSAY